MPKVSVIVPIYNVQEYLNKCIKSLINQTLDDIQIILVNDGSTDNSGNIAKEYANLYKDKIIYLEKQNGGLSDARNFGIPYAIGEYIAFLDADDYIVENAYELMYKKAKEENADMVECNFIWKYPNKEKIDIGKKYYVKQDMMKKIRVVAWNKLIKNKIIKENNIQFPKGLRYEDIEFTYRLIPYINKIAFVQKPLIYYIQRNNSIVNIQNEKTKEIFIILENVIQYYKEKNFYDNYKDELEYVYTRYMLCSSLKRISKIREKHVREKILKENWKILNEKFPDWKKNKILKNENNKKNIYMKTVNSVTYKLYTKLLKII